MAASAATEVDGPSYTPGSRDPMGIHRTIWGEDCDADYALPADKPLTCMSYMAGAGPEAFINFLSVGETPPQMPLFLTADIYVSVPLETTYALTWGVAAEVLAGRT